MRRLKAACEAHPAANKVMNGRNPISKFILRQRTIKAELASKEIPSKEQIFNNPKKCCKEFLETLEAKLEKHLNAKETVTNININSVSIGGCPFTTYT